jgi:hypothetical protein
MYSQKKGTMLELDVNHHLNISRLLLVLLIPRQVEPYRNNVSFLRFIIYCILSLFSNIVKNVEFNTHHLPTLLLTSC